MRANPVRSLGVVLGLAIFTVIFLSGCGGGGGQIATPPPGGTFTNSSLMGSYAFFYQGSDVNGSPFVAAGQFTANGSGMITSGAIDLNDATLGILSPGLGSGTIASTSTYAVSSDGETTVSLQVQAGCITLQMTLASSEHGVVTAFDGAPNGCANPVFFFSGSGTIDMQTVGAAVPANFAFSLTGIDLSIGDEALFGGNIAVTGGTTIQAGGSEADIVAPGLFSPPDTADTSLTGTLTPDVSNPGRATLVLTSSTLGASFSFAVYIVDSTHLEVAEVDTSSGFLLGGEAFVAPAAGNQQLTKGNYAYTVSGEAQNGGSFAAGGVFASNGSGMITGGIQDLHSTGGVSNGQSLAATAYTSDPNFARIVLTLNDGTVPFEYAGYPTSDGRLMIVEIDQVIKGDCECFAGGTGYVQTSTSALSGSFALNIMSLARSGKILLEQDAVGQITVSGSDVTGDLNVNNGQAKGDVLVDIPLASSTISTPDSTFGRGTMLSLQSGDLGNAGYSLSFYTVDGTRVLMTEVDKTRISTGQLLLQSQ
jgi:hypothetical protein